MFAVTFIAQHPSYKEQYIGMIGVFHDANVAYDHDMLFTWQFQFLERQTQFIVTGQQELGHSKIIRNSGVIANVLLKDTVWPFTRGLETWIACRGASVRLIGSRGAWVAGVVSSRGKCIRWTQCWNKWEKQILSIIQEVLQHKPVMVCQPAMESSCGTRICSWPRQNLKKNSFLVFPTILPLQH